MDGRRGESSASAARAAVKSASDTGVGFCISSSTYLEGMPRFKFWPPRRIAVATPITSPCSLNSGPPEEPGAIGAEICSAVRLPSSRTALTRPFDTVSSSPSG